MKLQIVRDNVYNLYKLNKYITTNVYETLRESIFLEDLKEARERILKDGFETIIEE